MPLCIFYTNLCRSKVPVDFAVLLSNALAEILSKPIEKITVNVLSDQNMAKGGTFEPTCWMNLWSIGVFNSENNPKFATKLYPLIYDKLEISSDRIVLLFHDIKPEQVAKPL